MTASCSAAHDVSDGGLGQALVEMALRGGTGAQIRLPAGLDPFVALFSESTARAVVALAPEQAQDFTDRCVAAGLAVTTLGTVGGEALELEDLFSVGLGELRATNEATLPALFG